MLYEKHVFSSTQLRIHCNEPYSYPSNTLSEALMDTESILDVTLYNPSTEKNETIAQILLFGNYF